MNQQLLNTQNDESDIFNDVLGGGVDPSIDESIRDSIKCSFVSSECDQSKQHNQAANDTLRDNYVMNRMNWLTYLKVLFDQLEQFSQNKQKHVENQNFIKALKKIKNLLPLQTKNEYYKNSSEVAFTYQDVENGVIGMPKYITWDNVIDIFLSKMMYSSQISNPRDSNAFQQLDTEDNYQEPQQIDDSQISDVNYKEEEVEQSFQNRNHRIKGHESVLQTGVSGQAINTNQKRKINKNDDFFLSFADSVIKMTAPNNTSQNNEYQTQQFLAHAPLIMDKDDDEACEIDSECSGGEESKHNSRRQKSRLEESIRSSRTATFKSVKGAVGGPSSIFAGSGTMNPLHTSSFSQHPLNTSSGNSWNQTLGHQDNISNKNNVAQDSYYATQSSSQKKSQPSALQNLSQQQQQIYYQQQQQQVALVSAKHANESQNLSQLSQEDGQVELGSNHSRTSSSRYRIINGENIFNYDEQMNYEKSTRISYLNSAQKTNVNNANNANNSTILSHNSSQSSQSQKKNSAVNNSKISIISAGQQSSSSAINSSNFVDLDLQMKTPKNFELDFKQLYGDKKVLRSINLSQNGLFRLPPNLEKSLQYLNVSFNKVKSLNGIDRCINLKFLNVQGNLIQSAQGIVLLQSLRELIFSYNQLSLVGEISQLRNLNLLDLSNNKFLDFEKVMPLQSLKKLVTLSLIQNPVFKQPNYEVQMKKILPQVQVLDPDQIKDFTQFQEMEHICFTDQPLMIFEQQSESNLVKQREVMSDQREKERSRTPNRERTKSQLGYQLIDAKLKTNITSPKRATIDSQISTKIINSNSKNPTIITSQTASTHQALSSRSKIQQLQNNLNQQLKTYQNQYSENKFKLQGKSEIIVPGNKGNLTSRNNTKERSVTPDNRTKNAQQQQKLNNNELARNRSTSANTARNVPSKVSQNKGQIKVQQQQLSHQVTGVSSKESTVKKVSVNVNVAKNYGSQGKLTPNRSNITTPRQAKEKPTHQYKKSFCQTEEEPSLSLDNYSERNTIKTAPTQDSSEKKPQNVKKVVLKEDLSLGFSPGQKAGIYNTMMSSLPSNSRNNLARPVTTIKQRANTSQQDDSHDYQFVSQTVINPPQSTKNGNYSQSFAFETGRSTPSHQMISQQPSRPSSQLHKFINASKNPSRLSAQTPGPSIPCQKLTNLPPKAYQSKIEKPGEKKSKADMSSSVVSSLQHSVALNSSTNQIQQQQQHFSQSQLSQNQNQQITTTNKMKTNAVAGNSILQTGDTNEMDESRNSKFNCDNVSSRSMSPVCDESNNIKKLKVDLTQYMNKQL